VGHDELGSCFSLAFLDRLPDDSTPFFLHGALLYSPGVDLGCDWLGYDHLEDNGLSHDPMDSFGLQGIGQAFLWSRSVSS
jgi:hypothetical protein